MDHSLGIKRPITSFQSGTHLAKRSRFLENGIKSMEVNVEAHTNKVDKVNASAQTSDLNTTEAELGKTGAAVHSRKSNDPPAVVPIKKRRIQLLEATRSPSPPSSLPQSSPQELSSSSHGEICAPLLPNSSLSGFSSVISPRSTVPVPVTPSVCQGCPLSVPDMQSVACEVEVPKVIEHSEGCSSEMEPKEQPSEKAEESLNDDIDISAQPGFPESVNGGQITQNMGGDQVCSQIKSDGQLVRSESGSFSRDDRLHWDLNTDMAAWDDLSEQGISKISEENCISVAPSRSPSVESAGTDGKQGDEDANEQLEDIDRKEVEVDNDSMCVAGENIDDKRESVEEELHPVEVAPEESEVWEGVNEHEVEEQVEDSSEIRYPMDDDQNIIDQDFSGNPDHRDTKNEEATPPSVHAESAWQAPDDTADYPTPAKQDSWDTKLSPYGRDMHDSEMLCFQDDMREMHKPGKQGKSSMDDGEGWNDEPELEERVDYGDSDCKDADDPGLDVDDRTSLMQVESRWTREDGPKSTFCEGEALGMGEAFHSSLTDIEQLPNRHASSVRNRTTGWDQLPEGFDSAEDALRAAKEDSTRRGGRGSLWSNCTGRGSLHTSRFGTSSVRGHNRDGFSAARGDNYYEERHPDEPSHDRDGFRHGRRADDNFSVRGRDPSRRPGVFGRGRASGWLDSQPSHMNQWGSGRHRSGSGYTGPSSAVAASTARSDNSGFVTAHADGAVTKNGMAHGRGGLRSAVSGGRVGRGAHTRGPHVDMDGGAHYPLRGGAGGERVVGMGLGYSGSMRDRSGRGMMDIYRGGGMDPRRSLSPRRPHLLDHPSMMGGRMPGMRPDSRVVRSRTPPPIHRSMGSSDFNIVRNHRTPPPSRWPNEKREPDSYQERDFKRPMSRTRLSSQRTLPHVVHGSSLTDERDRQVLARHSPPLKSSLAPSLLRKSKDDNLDSRAFKRIEEEDGRYTGSFGKDEDYRRGSSPRETAREREKGSLYRRERDRDDERRRDFRRSSSRDGRLPSGSRHSGIREGDDDVAPRRRRPS